MRRLPDGKPKVGSFTIQEARKAELAGKDIWKKYPARMLTWRARSIALRDAFPDILKGVRIAEELMGSDEPEEKNVTPQGGPPRTINELQQRWAPATEPTPATEASAQTEAPAATGTQAEYMATSRTSAHEPPAENGKLAVEAVKRNLQDCKYESAVTKQQAIYLTDPRYSEVEKGEIKQLCEDRKRELKAARAEQVKASAPPQARETEQGGLLG